MSRTTASQGSDSNINSSVSEIFKGLAEPSLISVFTALSICGGLIVLGIVFINEELFASDYHRYFAEGSLDFPVFVTSETLKLSESDAENMLVVAGASSTRVSVRKEKLTEIVGEQFAVFKLCTGRQSLWETAKLLDKIPNGSGGIVIIGMGPSRFTRGPEDLKKVLRSPSTAINSNAFDEELQLNGKEPVRRFGNYFLDNRRFIFVRLKYILKNIFIGPPEAGNRYFNRERTDTDKIQEIYAMVSSRFEKYDENYELNLAVLERIIGRLREKTRMSIVLLEHPVDPYFVEHYMGREFYEEHKERMREFAYKLGLPYWKVADQIGIREDDFYDWTHFRKLEKAEEYTAILGDLIIQSGNKTIEPEGNDE